MRVMEANRKIRNDLATAQGELKTANTKLQVWGELDHDDITQKLEKLTTYEAGQNVPELAEELRDHGRGARAAACRAKVKPRRPSCSGPSMR
jgi:hypothetical protein